MAGIIALLLLAFVLSLSGMAKLTKSASLGASLSDMGVPRSFARPLGRATPLAELLAAGALILSNGALPALGLVGAFFIVFAALGAVALTTHRQVECHCFGPLRRGRLGWAQIVQLPALLMAIFLIARDQPGFDLTARFGVLLGEILAVGLLSLCVARFAWHRLRSRRLKRLALERAMATVSLQLYRQGGLSW